MQAAPGLIAHFFSCPNCGRVKEVKTKMQAQAARTSRRSYPRHDRLALRPPTAPPPKPIASSQN